ncbi:unannotated protein [freshwater metagenome]|uniref:Unannotated protein n=1 Tax=freshwater metagenome TaxID=449393 RepID=A0A6J7NRQ4_9ZZZZ
MIAKIAKIANRLDEIPAVAIAVFKHDHGAVGLEARLFGHTDAALNKVRVMSREVGRVKKETNASTSLPSDGGALLGSGRNGEEQRRSAFGIRRDPDPALSTAQVRVLDEVESQITDEVRYRLVIVINEDSHSVQPRHRAKH